MVRKRGLSSSEKCSLGSAPTQNEPPGSSDVPGAQLNAGGGGGGELGGLGAEALALAVALGESSASLQAAIVPRTPSRSASE